MAIRWTCSRDGQTDLPAPGVRLPAAMKKPKAAAVGAGPVIDYLRSVGAPEGRGGRRLQAR